MMLYVIYIYVYIYITTSAHEAEVLADVPAAEVAVLEDERMAGNMQVAGIHGGMLWLL